ncbi:MAG TPA: response regulator transcription factor [Chromatiales bacterium]|nr:response regulator transcription factor [Chromatiales bacterium]
MTEPAATPVVHVVDDDPGVRRALSLLLESNGLDVHGHDSAEAFLASYDPARPGCLVLDVRMPTMSGLELQHELKRREITIPIIFLTGHGDVPMAAQAFRAGAVDFLEKPFEAEQLLARIDDAVKRDLRNREKAIQKRQARACYERLTPREREVMALVVEGKSNKEIARLLDVSHRTIDVHRARVMEKMRVRTLPQLVDKAVLCGLHDPA